jgi:arsenate reductase
MRTWDYQSDDQFIMHAVDQIHEEFAGTFSKETVRRFVADSINAFHDAKVRRFLPLFVQRFAKERLRAYAQAEGTMSKEIPEVLFVCVHNAGRSQMAAGLLERAARGRVHVRSAGSTPADEIHSNVRTAMDEVGIDLSQEFPKPLTDEVVRAADVVITMGCGDACPVYPGKRYLDWDLPDPKDRSLEDVRFIRDEIDRKVRALVEELVPATS